jgi:hypothetical protein
MRRIRQAAKALKKHVTTLSRALKEPSRGAKRLTLQKKFARRDTSKSLLQLLVKLNQPLPVVSSRLLLPTP